MSGLQQLQGKVAVVTGGASGIGRAIAARLVDQGMKVVIADIEEAALDKTAAEIGALGIRTDVSSLESVQSLADEVVRQYGGVDLFCNNAGVASTAKIEDMSLSDWDWIIGVNVFGLIHGMKAFLPLLRANPDGGYLTVTASMSSFHVTPEVGGYAVSKFAVVALAETLALELEADEENIGVTILCPGPVSSNLGASQRNRSAEITGGGMVDNDLEQSDRGQALRWITPESVADTLLQAIKRGDLYAFTHPEWEPMVQKRYQKIAEAFEAASTAG